MVGYFQPQTVQEALERLAVGDSTVAAGCTDLFPATEHQSLAGTVLDITRLAELRGISETGTGWRVGANTTWSAVIDAVLPASFDGLKSAAGAVGSVQIQNAATIGGNICNASPAADGVPALLTLEAEVEMSSTRGSRRMPLQSFIKGPRQIALQPDELMVAIHVPASAARGQSGFLKLGSRKHLVISIAMVAVRLVVTDGKIQDAAISVGACSPVATRLVKLENALKGASVDAALGIVKPALIEPELTPIEDIRADRNYRFVATAEITRRAVASVLAKADGLVS
ncbi:MAG: xanthine dehydrogenase family protein subunit M [Rhodobacteraceae bacterium]|nr:xanthine dehydrogenase family protein subunit M [Paracoccaceae bacterium]